MPVPRRVVPQTGWVIPTETNLGASYLAMGATDDMVFFKAMTWIVILAGLMLFLWILEKFSK